ncbi:hypothetical protein DL768_006590 [Monosporascus sp. mg162]|nr:hypothetical protein DL768_006590 [Monosporascus sp. mg162]
MTDSFDSSCLALTPQYGGLPWTFGQNLSSASQMMMQACPAGHYSTSGWLPSGGTSISHFATINASGVPLHQASDTDSPGGSNSSSMATSTALSPSVKATSAKQISSSRPKRRRSQQAPSPESFSLTPSTKGSKSRLRSASRASKNANHNPPTTAEERRSRECHNQVEKQYRNRLNAQFESLLDALPENMRRGEDGDDGGYPFEGLHSPERKVSRAEVLDMARRRIKLLEKECALLESERDELRDNVEKLRWLFGRWESSNALVQGSPFPARTDSR